MGGTGAHGLPFSKAMRAGDFVFVSGQVAFDDYGRLVDGGIEAQTSQVLRNIEAVLKEAGCTLDDVVKVNVWLDDPRDFGRFNATYATFFPMHPPARSTVESRIMIDAKVEIDCIAYSPA
ncbi:RidA family protein [Mesorhizobium sp. NPDC059054]|uniref:RidA family protein n=1 Tax=unclassified Mesorhizobium TaxID=325217 RepID=UPI00367583F4